MTFWEKRKQICTGVLLSLFLVTSCNHATDQEISRSLKDEDITVTVDSSLSMAETDLTIVDPDTSESLDPNSWLVRVSDPERMQFHPDAPKEYDFSVSFKEDMLVVDYGKQTVNVYIGKYDKSPEPWQNKTWDTVGAIHVVLWCEGEPTNISCEELDGEIIEGDDYVALEKAEVLDNIYNVHIISLSDIEGGSELTEALGLSTDTAVLSWTYNLYDFPWDSEYFNAIESFKVPSTITTFEYIPLSAQYIDGVPTRLPAGDAPTIDWLHDGNLARPAHYDPRTDWGKSYLFNQSFTCATVFHVYRYMITDTIQEEVPIIPADSCLAEIKKAILYNAYSHLKATPDSSKIGMNHVWETDVVVYCMELSYAVLDPCPLDPYEDDLDSHELTMVPVWNVYYTATNSKVADENVVYSGTVMVSAVTGESIYSEMYGPDENEYLYPR
ncbi:MAG: hypothetical protein IK020_10945 [Clostridiales bacterium]|nr:hypothetical protein [Clostridiales bacterium]